MLRLVIPATLVLLVGALCAQQDVAPKRNFGLAKPIKISAETEVYGGELKALPLATVVGIEAKPDAWKGKTVQLRGKIDKVCAKKGCWMTLAGGKEPVRVGFKDYSFFVPLDAAGREVAVEGIVDVRVETEAERRHYAEDAKKSKEEVEAIKGDKVVISFVADAVQIGKLPEAPAAAKLEVLAPAKDAGGPVCPDVKAGEKKEGCGGCTKQAAEGTEKKAGCTGCEKKSGEVPAQKEGCNGCVLKAGVVPATKDAGAAPAKKEGCGGCEKMGEKKSGEAPANKEAGSHCEKKAGEEPAKKDGCGGCEKPAPAKEATGGRAPAPAGG